METITLTPPAAGMATERIQSAIDRLHRNCGGTVILQGGEFVSGTIRLRSNIELRLEAGARLVASPDIADYATDTHWNRYRNEHELDRCFIFAQDAENIALTGEGEINGSAAAFPNPGNIYRPMLIRILRCKKVRLSGLRLYDAAAWTTAFLDSEYIEITGLDIQNATNYNGDGLDFDGCAHVRVEDCHICGTDDNLCLQAGARAYPVHDIRVKRCRFSSVCAAIRIGLRSIGDIYDVDIRDCKMESVWREGVKIECTEGGTIRDIVVDDLEMRDVRRPIFILLNNRFEPEGLGSSLELDAMPEIGHLENITLSRIRASDGPEMEKIHRRFGRDIMGAPAFNGIRADAEQDHPIRGLTLRDISYTAIGGVALADIPAEYPQVLDRRKYPDARCAENYWPDWSRAALMDLRNVEDLTVEGLDLMTVRPDGRPPVIMENCRMKRPNASIWRGKRPMRGLDR